MAGSWEKLCRAKDLRINGSRIEVRIAEERAHRVTVADVGEAYELKAIVVRRDVLKSLRDLPTRIWIQNRATQLVGFRIDLQSRLVAESWVPKAGLTAEEFQLYVRTVAAESDRFEFVLTGKDVE